MTRNRDVFIALALVLGIAIAVGFIYLALSGEDEAPEALLTPPQGQPDLSILGAKVELENGTNCNSGLGLGVTVRNTGDSSAVDFIVEANDTAKLIDQEVFPDSNVYIWFAGTQPSYEIVLDPDNQIDEQNEDNNVFAGQLPIPTLPAECQ